MKIRDKIIAVLNSDISAYALEKQTGIKSPTTIRLRNGTRKLDKLELNTVEKFEDYFEKNIEKL